MKLIYLIAAIAFSYSGVAFLVKSEESYCHRVFSLEGKSDKGKILAFIEEKDGYYLFSSEIESKFPLQNIISSRWLNPETNSYEDKDLAAEIKMDIVAGDIIPNGFYLSFMSIFGTGCRKNTKAALMAAFRDGFRKVKSDGLLERVIFYRDIRNITNEIKGSFEGVKYYAGQDYPAEIRTIRRIICEKYL